MTHIWEDDGAPAVYITWPQMLLTDSAPPPAPPPLLMHEIKSSICTNCTSYSISVFPPPIFKVWIVLITRWPQYCRLLCHWLPAHHVPSHGKTETKAKTSKLSLVCTGPFWCVHWKNNPARDDRSREDSNSCKTQRASEEVMRKHQILAFPDCQKMTQFCPFQGCQGWGVRAACCSRHEGAGVGRWAWGDCSEVKYSSYKH